MKIRSVLLVVLLLSGASSLQGQLTLRSKALMRDQANALLKSSECEDKLRGLRLLKRADGQTSRLHDQTFAMFSACADPYERVLALLIGASPQFDDFNSDELGLLDSTLASEEPLLRGVGAFILSGLNQLSDRQRAEGLRAADEKRELLFFCAVVKSPSDHERCARIGENFGAVVEELLYQPVDELLPLEAHLLGEKFPAEALATIPDLRRSSRNSRSDQISVIRKAWSESATAHYLAESLASFGDDSRSRTDAIELIRFLRLATPGSVALLAGALRSGNTDQARCAIAAAEAIGQRAPELAEPLQRLVLSSEGSIRHEAALALVRVSPSAANALAEELKAKVRELFLAIKKRLLQKPSTEQSL
jgi:hypothetical protein